MRRYEILKESKGNQQMIRMMMKNMTKVLIPQNTREYGLHITTPLSNVATTNNIQIIEPVLDVVTSLRDVATSLRYSTFIQEKGFDPLLRICKGIWENATAREWKKFCLPSKKPTLIPMVQEFYLALQQKEATRPLYEMRSIVKIKGVNVPVTDEYFPFS
ncbi:hypothetical protein Goshw_024500 [Gossypium schwendimanii]|uniref:Uncharacterized protein n=1 Tax=Gossypium schwendimanii TaxID=34291 RepID=A0A7J9N2Z1_GOSSC|nr:hypothetical protein [Gossypium schwendimanii]